MILNLTQHKGSEDQRKEGVVDLQGEQHAALVELLNFNGLPEAEEILDRAHDIAELACFNGLGGDEGDDPFITRAMIGGALWLMAPLARKLRERGIEPLFAFSVRDSVEQVQDDGKVVKTAVFRHAGWVPAL